MDSRLAGHPHPLPIPARKSSMPVRLSIRILLAGAALIGTVVGVGACAPLKVLNGLVPGDTYRSERDIV